MIILLISVYQSVNNHLTHPRHFNTFLVLLVSNYGSLYSSTSHNVDSMKEIPFSNKLYIQAQLFTAVKKI